MMDQEFLNVIACPETKQPLRPADEAVIRKINEGIDAGIVVNRGGQKVTEKIDTGLVREDGQWLYPVRKDIPVLLIDEAIAPAGGSGQAQP